MKHKYSVSGIYSIEEVKFNGSCIASDIKQAIDLFQSQSYSVHKIEKGEQVKRSEMNRIVEIRFL